MPLTVTAAHSTHPGPRASNEDFVGMVTPDEPAARPANFVSGYEHLPVRFTPTARAG